MKFQKISYGKNVYDQREINAVIKSLKNGTQSGDSVLKFEKKVAKVFSKKHGLMVNSGSSANTLALESLNLKKGSNIITPLLTFGTTIAPMIRLGLIPNFIDIKLDTLNIDEDLVEKAINDKTSAIMVPNLIGNIPNFKTLRKIANKYKLKLIEDSADTIGGSIYNKPCGYYSDIITTSFYGSHIISCAGNGGMVCFNKDAHYTKSKILRSWGRTSSIYKESENIKNRFAKKVNKMNYDSKFIFSEIGYNFEPSESGAAFGLVQLAKLKSNIKIRENNFKRLFNYVSENPKYFIKPLQYKYIRTPWLAFPIIINYKSKIIRNKFQIYLEKNGIQTRPIFTGNILKQPGFKKIKRITHFKNYPNTDYIMKNGILIGCHQGLVNKNIDYMIYHLKKFTSIYA